MQDTNLTLDGAKRELSDLMRAEGSFKQTARGALEIGRRYLSVEDGCLTQIDPETDHWKAIVSTDGEGGRFPEGLTLDLETTYCRRAFVEDSSIAVHDASTQGWESDPAFNEHGLSCYHGTTLHVDGEPYGTVCFVSEDARQEPFSDTETLFIEYLAQSLERELEREQHQSKLTRQTNLSLVLNRVLRHNLRNGMSIIRGFTQLMTDQLEDTSHGNAALEEIDRVIRLCEKARQLDQIVAADFEREPTDIVSLVTSVAEAVGHEHPAASISVEADEAVSLAVFPSFERAIRELVGNAAKHGGDAPAVTVSVESAPNAVEIHISDDGPGLASHEMDVFEMGTETPLTHGTGLGLWLSHWIVSGHDGSLECDNTGNGTMVSLSVPRMSDPGEVGTKQTLTRTHDQYQTAFEEAGDGMIIVNDEAHIVDANPEAATIYGVERQELLGRSIREFLPDDFDFEAEWDAIRTAQKRRDEMPVVSADGGVSAVEYTTKSDVIAPGLHLLTTRDVTERKERERELAETTERFRTFVENSHDLISVIDADGIAQYHSPAAERLLGYAPETLVGSDIFEYIHPEDRERISEQFERLVTRSDPTTEVFEYRVRHADSTWVRFESTASNRTATAVDGLVINSREVTEPEAPATGPELRRENDRLEEFASIVSHDLRNPLGVAEGHAELAAAACDCGHDHDHFERIESAHDRMYALIEDLLTLARTDAAVTDSESIGLASIATGCWENVETDRAALVVASDRTIRGDKTRLKQLFENLIRNGIEHGGEGVTVTVGALEEGFYLEDDGSGIPEDDRETVFESGYSTNQDGTGFGLSIVRQIAAAHDWEVAVTESDDGGARFEVTGVPSAK